MRLLLKREQKDGLFGRVNFFLRAQLELGEDERALIKRYKFEHSLLLGTNQTTLLRNSLLLGTLVAFIVTFILSLGSAIEPAAFMGIICGGTFGFWFFNERREEIFVRDLIHGRHFKCPSIIDLIKTEAELSHITALFRQVIESAKNWDGTEIEEIPVLTRDAARELILKAYHGWQ